jgi:hypothetical protein
MLKKSHKNRTYSRADKKNVTGYRILLAGRIIYLPATGNTNAIAGWQLVTSNLSLNKEGSRQAAGFFRKLFCNTCR